MRTPWKFYKDLFLLARHFIMSREWMHIQTKSNMVELCEFLHFVLGVAIVMGLICLIFVKPKVLILYALLAIGWVVLKLLGEYLGFKRRKKMEKTLQGLMGD